MTPDQRASRSARYYEISHDGALDELFTSVETSIAEDWKATFDAFERDNLWRSIQLLRKLRQHLQSGITAGLNQTQLTELRRLGKPR